jgi:hypothetical protein
MAYIDVDLRDMRQTLGKEVVDMSSLKVKKLNKTTRGIVGNFIIKATDVGNSMQVATQFWKKQGGEYRKLPYKLPSKNLCDFFNEDIYFIPEILKVSNVLSPLPSPVPSV